MKLSKTALRELTRLYRAVLLAAIVGTVAVAGTAKADWVGHSDTITNGTESTAMIFNESDGGGVMFIDKTDGITSFVGVHDGETGGFTNRAQIYAVESSGDKNGARLNITANGMYYTVGKKADATNAADQELVTVGTVASKATYDSTATYADGTIGKAIKDLATTSADSVGTIKDSSGNETSVQSILGLSTATATEGQLIFNSGVTNSNLNNGTTTAPATVVDALQNMDKSVGQIHGLAATLTDAQGAKNLEQGSTVSGHLVALANAIGDRTDYSGTNYLTNNQDIADSLITLDGALGDVEDMVGNHNTVLNTFAGIIDGSSMNTDGTRDASSAVALTAYDSATSLTGVVNKLEINKQELLTNANNAGNGIVITDGTTPKIAVNAGNGIEVGTSGVAVKAADASISVAAGGVSVAVDGSTIELGTSGLQVKDGGITTAKLDATAQNNLWSKATSGYGLTITKGDDTTPANIDLKLADKSLSADGSGVKVALATDSGLQVLAGGLAVKTGAGISQSDANGLYIDSGAIVESMIDGGAVTADKIGTKAVTAEKIDTNAVTTDKIKNGNVTFAKLGSDVYTTTVGAGSDELLATTSAVKSYTDDAISDAIDAAIFDNSDNTVTLTTTAGASNVYTVDGADAAIKAKAEGADYTGTQVNGGTSPATIKSALTATNKQVDINSGTLVNLYSAINGGTYTVTTGAVTSADTLSTDFTATNLTAAANELLTGLEETNDLLGAAETTAPAATSLVTDKIDGTETNVIAALRTVADNAAGLSAANTFTGSNTFTKNTTFEQGVTIGASGVLTEQTGVTFKGLEETATDQKITKITGVGALVAEGTSIATTNGFSVVKKDSGDVYSELVAVDKDGIRVSNGTNVNFTVDKDGNVSGAKGTFSDKLTVTANGADITGNTLVKGTFGAGTNGTEFTVDGSGNTAVAGTLGVAKDFAVNTSKFTVAAETGNTAVAGTLGVAKDFAVNTSKFTVAAETGNTTVAGTLNVAGASTFGNNVTIKDGETTKITLAKDGSGTFGNNVTIKDGETTKITLAKDGSGTFAGKLTVSANGADITGNTLVKGTFGAGTDGTKFTVDGSGNTTVGGTLGITGKTTFGEAGFNLGGKDATAIDAGAAAITEGAATTLASTKTVLMSAENAQYTGEEPINITGEAPTIKSAIADLDAAIGDMSDFDGNNVATNQTEVAANLAALDGAVGDMNFTGESAAGSTDLTSAVNSLDSAIGDLNFDNANYLQTNDDVSTSLSRLDSNLARVEGKVTQLESEVRAGFAAAAAMAALVPNARAAGDTQIAVGTGNYRDRVGFALGAFHYINDNILVNAGAAYGGTKSATFKAGVTFGW